MKGSIITRLERAEKELPVIDESKRIDRIVLCATDDSVEPVVLWTRPVLLRRKMSIESRLAPAGYRAHPQFEKSQALASKTGKPCYYLESVTASSLPFWTLLPLDSLTDELLDEQIARLQRDIAATEAAQSQTGTNAND